MSIGLIAFFAITGLFDWILGPLALRGFRALMYATETDRIVWGPGRRLQAVAEITRGGFGTVWTTRIAVREPSSSRQSYVYENRDSDFRPPMRWLGPDMLLLCVPSGRVDHMSNPFAYAAGSRLIDRMSVRFTYCPAGAERRD